MYISGQVLLIMLLVGLVAGWLAGQLVKGAGFGLIADVAATGDACNRLPC